MSRQIRKAAVLGAGTMGGRIAAHLANAGVNVLLLDLDKPTVTRLFEGMQKSRPPALFTPADAARIRTGTFSDDLPKIADADWIIEAVVENFEAKRKLLPEVDRRRKPGTLVSSNTSGLPIAGLADGLSADFRAHWLGTHFFNPPRQMRLVEIIPTPETRPEVVEFVRDFCDRRLGKITVFAKDRPNFIANRLFLFAFIHLLKAMQAHGLTIEEVDALTGPLIGRPSMATFRLGDFVGVDVCVFVGENVYRLAPDDEKREMFVAPDFLRRMMEKGLIGDKAGQGFYKRTKSAAGADRLVLDLDTLQYRPARPVELPAIESAQRIRDTGARIRYLIGGDDPAGALLWETISELLLYAARRIPEITDDITSVDATMRHGFNWELGLFEIWDRIGVRESAARMQADGKTPAALVDKLLQSGAETFYREERGERFFFDLASGTHQPEAAAPGVLRLATVYGRNRRLLSNPSASLLDLGDGILCLEFHSKANSVDPNVMRMMRAAVEEAEAHYEGLVIGSEGPNFCVGANLQFLLELSREGRWDPIRQAVETMQHTCLALRDCRKPVVAAVFGQTLAGGCEIAMHAARRQALAETYIGLPEAGVGLIPGAGGTKEMLARWMSSAPAEGDPLPYLKPAFEIIAMGKVSSCAAEAVAWRYLDQNDPLTMNSQRLIEDARQTALAMARAGYAPPVASPLIPVMGRGGFASLKLILHLMKEAHYISEYDAKVGEKLAYVLSGGELTAPATVPERYLLELEREAFLSLCGEPKTQERMEHMLRTGKPLRN